MPQSAFSFHCMICFEEFHPDERYPVVLPCGHTYVCNLCGDRLDKCMECRTPLVWSLPRPQATGAPSPASRSTYRSSRTPQPSSPTVPPIRKRFPLPKNVVLLSLIEATELATEDASRKHDASPVKSSDQDDETGKRMQVDGDDNDDDDDVSSIGAHVDQDDQEEERIRLGTSVALSVAGTYAVTAPNGLQICPSRHDSTSRTSSLREGTNASDEDVDALVKYFHMDHRAAEAQAAAEDELKENRAEVKQDQPPGNLSPGDRVQVVAIERGWAKLARGYGFVRADNNKLVKVGGSLDRSCKLEAILRSLSTQRRQLRMEQSKVDNMFIRFMNELQVSLMTDEDLTVIVADTFVKASGDFSLELQEEIIDKVPGGIAQAASQDDGPVKPANNNNQEPQEARQDGHVTPTVITNAARGLACFANDVFDTISGTGSDGEFQPANHEQLMRQRQEAPRTVSPPRRPMVGADLHPSIFPSATHPSPSAMSAGARAWRELHGRTESTGVDFKTGMSGHAALFSSNAHPHEYLDHRRGVGGFRKMSTHTGLTMTKPFRKTVGDLYNSMYQSLYPTLNMPSLSGGLASTPERGGGQDADTRADVPESL